MDNVHKHNICANDHRQKFLDFLYIYSDLLQTP
jgi:hypothetical protein